MKKYRFSQSNLVSVTNVVKDDVAIQVLNAIKHTGNKIGNSLVFTQLS